MNLQDPVWRVQARDELVWRDWGDEVVVFDERNGSTHLLTSEAGVVLASLIEHPDGLAPEQLRREVFGGDAQAQDRDDLDGLLAQFEHMGLVSRRAG